MNATRGLIPNSQFFPALVEDGVLEDVPEAAGNGRIGEDEA